MQTFLPYSDFKQSAQCLDRQRLGKQRVEAYQIMRILLYDLNTGWSKHPAVQMWRGHVRALLYYYAVMCEEWQARGYQQVKLPKLASDNFKDAALPGWVFDVRFLQSHRSNLLRKNKDYYSQFAWQVADNLPYVWSI